MRARAENVRAALRDGAQNYEDWDEAVDAAAARRPQAAGAPASEERSIRTRTQQLDLDIARIRRLREMDNSIRTASRTQASNTNMDGMEEPPASTWDGEVFRPSVLPLPLVELEPQTTPRTSRKRASEDGAVVTRSIRVARDFAGR